MVGDRVSNNGSPSLLSFPLLSRLQGEAQHGDTNSFVSETFCGPNSKRNALPAWYRRPTEHKTGTLNAGKAFLVNVVNSIILGVHALRKKQKRKEKEEEKEKRKKKSSRDTLSTST